MSNWIRKMIRIRRAVFKLEGWSEKWKIMKRNTTEAIDRRRKKYNQHIIDKLLSNEDQRNFFRNVQTLSGEIKRPRWSPTDMYPDEDKKTVAEKLAAFFNGISLEYVPLDLTNLPITFNRALPILSDSEVAEKLLKSKKGSSRVNGDINSKLYGIYADTLADPATAIFNNITRSFCWPTEWKKEHITIIPKIPCPQEPGQCRNIACTNFLSKIYEGFVM